MYKTTLSKITSFLLALSIVVVFTAMPYDERGVKQTANALFSFGGFTTVTAILTDSPETKAIAVSSGANAATNALQLQKDAWYDGIAGMLAKTFLRQVVSSIVTWINSGFQGSPAFVTDLDGFLLNVADQVVGDFIYNDPSLNALCSPFQLDVKIALAVQYSNSRPGNYSPQCTLSQVANNVEGFLNGNFADGGWAGLVEMVQTPENNPMGAYISAQEEAYIRIIDAQGREVKKLDFGDGFFSMEICDIADKQSGARPNCTIGTPGSVIANSINKSLGAPQDELIAADEINEIFNALFSQLAQKAISGIYGLLGLGGNSAYSDPYGFDGGTYLEAIAAQDASTTLNNNFLASASPIAQSLQAEEEYQLLLNQAITRAKTAQTTYNTTKTTLEAESCSFNVTFPTEITDFRTDAESRLAVSANTLAILKTLDEAFNSATDFNSQQSVVAQYNQINSQGLFRSPFDNTVYEVKLNNELILDISTLQSELATAEADCN